MKKFQKIVFILLCIIFSFQKISFAQNNNKLLSWSTGQSQIVIPLVSPVSRDLVKKEFVTGDTGVFTLTRYSFFRQPENIDHPDNQSRISISLSYTQAEKQLGEYSDTSLSDKNYLTESISGDCVLKEPFIFPADQLRKSALIIMALNPFPRYSDKFIKMKPTRLYFMSIIMDRNGGYITKLVKSIRLNKYYCLRSDIFNKIINGKYLN
jgi:hypothetical protein